MTHIPLTIATTDDDHFRESGIRTAKDLAGKRVGSPEWAHAGIMTKVIV